MHFSPAGQGIITSHSSASGWKNHLTDKRQIWGLFSSDRKGKQYFIKVGKGLYNQKINTTAH